MSGRIDFAMNLGDKPNSHKRRSDRGGLLYIFGDFSGQARVDNWPPTFVRIDRDNFDEVMAKLAVAIEVGPDIRLAFTCIEDFHPDVWLPQVDLLADLLSVKEMLQNPATAARAAASIQAFLPSATQDDVVTESQPSAEGDEAMWMRLLGKLPDDEKPADSVADWVKQMVSPHIVQPVSASQQDLARAADELLSQFTRVILHDAGFQGLEARWRATFSLLQEERAEHYTVYLVDMSMQALQQLLKTETTALAACLNQHGASRDDEAEVLVVADWVLTATPDAADLLSRCGDFARLCGGRFLAGGDVGFCQSLLVDAGSIPGLDDNLLLAYPRYLSRLPYHPKIDPLERFDFTECDELPAAEELAWANAAFLVARTLLRGEDNAAGFFADVPVFSYVQNGEAVLQPGAETVLSEAQANALLVRGIVPVLGFHQRRGVRVVL